MSNNVENLSPQIIRGVVREMQSLVSDPPEGIKVQINDEDVTDIQAFIEGPAGKQMVVKTSENNCSQYLQELPMSVVYLRLS